ncbi:hypothetical protein F5Y03DRAFT_127276 [Xylaria venustula]|nr:hypothetical protein F5Y03DRAFT_127276 [Xylaria venustula]
MADARALLRAHRAENRIKHPHAAYSDAGKLLCKLCHDVIKTESLWDTHIRSQNHRQRLQALQRQQQQQQQQQPSPPSQGTEESAQHKRKRSEDVDESMSDVSGEDDTAIPAKRSKTEAAAVSQTSTSSTSVSNGIGNGIEGGSKEKTQTPPGLARRTSGTPVQGVEIAIPSRPATPLAGSNSAVSTPKAISMARSPLVGSDRSSTSGASAAAGATSIPPISNDMLAVPTPNTTTQAPQPTRTPNTNNTPTAQNSGAVDEAEWAAFEAEMSVLDVPAAPTSQNAYADATISAPALSAAQVAAKSEEEEHERRKHAMDAEIADEREDATRALEAEFEEMEELEGRVRRLKERREELRKGSVLNLRGAATTTTLKKTADDGGDVDGKENVRANGLEEEEEDDDDEEEDEWDGFRFRA